jgi:hypothetical protein
MPHAPPDLGDQIYDDQSKQASHDIEDFELPAGDEDLLYFGDEDDTGPKDKIDKCLHKFLREQTHNEENNEMIEFIDADLVYPWGFQSWITGHD